MSNISLTIPNMKSPHCQMTVTGAVQQVGARVKSIAPTRVEIETNDLSTREIIKAIENAGYRVTE